MLTDEEAQELQAANAALRRALELWRHWYADRRVLSQGESDKCLAAAAIATLDALTTGTSGARLALERATMQALRQRVAERSHADACDCPRCERDRGILAQWAALGGEA